MKKNIIILLLFLVVGISHITINVVEAKSEKLEIKVDYIDENAKDSHCIYWGSEIALYVFDDSSSKKMNNNIQWNITSDNNNHLEVYTEEYKTGSGDDAIRIYAPYGYCDDIQIQAVSSNNKTKSNIYKLNISDGTEWNGESYFTFSANKPADVNISGNEPITKEKWDSTNGSYSIIIPHNLYKIEGYRFKHWEDDKGKAYYPDDKLSVSILDSPAYYELHAVWEKDIKHNKKKSNIIGNRSDDKHIIIVFVSAVTALIICIGIVLRLKNRKN